jgi:hypothetical protein
MSTELDRLSEAALRQPGAARRAHGVKFQCPQCAADGHDAHRDNACLFLPSGRWASAWAADPAAAPAHKRAIGRALRAAMNGAGSHDDETPTETTPGTAPESDTAPGAFRATDVGNARRFAGEHGNDVRYCYARRSWYVWDATHWRQDDGDRAAARAKQTARGLWAEAAAAPTEEQRRALAKWAIYAESEPGIRRMLELAKSEPGIPVTLDALDSDPWLLNCPNGTLELRTGHLRPHRREDLITKTTAAPYDPDARHPVFDAFLARALPDDDVRASCSASPATRSRRPPARRSSSSSTARPRAASRRS